jgi:hypothetical protein
MINFLNYKFIWMNLLNELHIEKPNKVRRLHSFRRYYCNTVQSTPISPTSTTLNKYSRESNFPIDQEFIDKINDKCPKKLDNFLKTKRSRTDRVRSEGSSVSPLKS